MENSIFNKDVLPKVILIVTTLAFSTSLYALPVTINTVGADWGNVIGGASTVSYYDTDGIAGNEEIRWGIPAETDQSGYRFDNAAPPAFIVK